MQEFNNGNSIYTGGVRYLANDEETTCIRCGHDAEKARALRLPAPTMPKPGYIHCKLCSPDEVYCAADHNPTHREEQRRIEAEIRDCFLEDTRRGEKGGGSSAGRRREKKPGEKITIRYEQEWQGFINGNGSGECEATVTVTQVRTALKRLNLSLPAVLKAELERAANAASTDVSFIVRKALDTHLASEDQPALPGTVERADLQVRVYEDQYTAIEVASAHWSATKSDIAASCCRRFLGTK